MSAGRDESDGRRSGASALALLGAFWGYAALVGVLAALGGTLLAMLIGDGTPSAALRLCVIVAVAAVAGWWSPALIRLVRRLAMRER